MEEEAPQRAPLLFTESGISELDNTKNQNYLSMCRCLRLRARKAIRCNKAGTNPSTSSPKACDNLKKSNYD